MNRSIPVHGIMPEGMKEFSRTKVFTEETAPEALRRHHCLSHGIWGLLDVKSGALKYTVKEQGLEIDVKQGQSVVIPPDVLHFVTPSGRASFDVAFYKKDEEKSGDSCCA